MKLDELVLFAPGVEIFNLLTAMRVQSRKIVLNLRQLRDIFSDEGRSVMQKFFDQQQEVQDLVIRSFEQNFAFFSDSLKDKKLQSLAVVVVVINRYDDEDPNPPEDKHNNLAKLIDSQRAHFIGNSNRSDIEADLENNIPMSELNETERRIFSWNNSDDKRNSTKSFSQNIDH